VPDSKDSLKAVILVGGPGTRLQPHTNYIPKPMVPVLNKPFLEHTIAYLKHYGVDNIILTLSYLPEVIQDYFGDGSRFGVFTDLDIFAMVGFHRRNRAKATISLKWVDNTSAFGVVETDGDGRVSRFIEKPSPNQTPTHWINAGTYILEPEVLGHVPANSHYMFETGLFPLLLKLGEPVYGHQFNGYWLDMGTEEKYLGLNCDLLLAKVPSYLIRNLSRDGIYCDEGVVIHPSAEIVGPVIIGRDCQISQKASIRGPVVIGPDCCVGEGAIIESATLWRGIHIGAGAICKQRVISNDNQLAHGLINPDSRKRLQ